MTGGPVEASGYRWLQVAPLGVELRGGRGRNAAAVDQGWVAIADQDGTPWVAPAEDPTPGFDLASATVERASAGRSAAREAALAQNAFGLALYRRMLRDRVLDLDDRSVVMSPTSLMTALAMARAGARGETASEMDDGARAGRLGPLPGSPSARSTRPCDPGTRPGATPVRPALPRPADGEHGLRAAGLRHPALSTSSGSAAAFGSPLGLVDYVADPDGRPPSDQRVGLAPDDGPDPRPAHPSRTSGIRHA